MVVSFALARRGKGDGRAPRRGLEKRSRRDGRIGMRGPEGTGRGRAVGRKSARASLGGEVTESGEDEERAGFSRRSAGIFCRRESFFPQLELPK